MRTYVIVPHYDPDAPAFPAGTPAYTSPAAALEAARAARAELIYLYNAAVVDGLTVKELCPRHPARAYPTRRTVLHYDGQSYRLRDTEPDKPRTHTTAHSTAHSASTTTTHRPPAPRHTDSTTAHGDGHQHDGRSMTSTTAATVSTTASGTAPTRGQHPPGTAPEPSAPAP